MPFFVYVLLNPQGKTYVGQTADLERRLNQHNDPTCRLTLHTKRHPGPWRLLHFEEVSSRSAAISRERELKSGKGRESIRGVLLGGCYFAAANC
jgi:putative endonuclease